jgi:prepilin-type N-terminal cleavage/methylation domain-containing protein
VPNKARRHVPAAFTLVETLVVIAIIGVIMGLIIPAVSAVRAESRSTHCLSNLRQIHTALDTARQQRSDVLPYAAPLPLPSAQIGLVPSLPELLKPMIPLDASTWMCPADQTQDSEDLGTSYLYVAGAFMLLEPPMIPDSPNGAINTEANINRIARVITQRYNNGYLRSIPVMADSGDYHAVGSRQPRNALFLDGSARIVKPSDGHIVEVDHPG